MRWRGPAALSLDSLTLCARAMAIDCRVRWVAPARRAAKLRLAARLALAWACKGKVRAAKADGGRRAAVAGQRAWAPPRRATAAEAAGRRAAAPGRAMRPCGQAAAVMAAMGVVA